jgi:hypothetical protein
MSWSVCFIGHVMFKGGEGYILIGACGGCFIYYCKGYIFIIRLNMGLCVRVSTKASFICNLCLLKYCGIVQVYLVLGLSFHSVVFLMFGRLCHMCVLCQVYRVYFEFCLFGFMAWNVLYIRL